MSTSKQITLMTYLTSASRTWKINYIIWFKIYGYYSVILSCL